MRKFLVIAFLFIWMDGTVTSPRALSTSTLTFAQLLILKSTPTLLRIDADSHSFLLLITNTANSADSEPEIQTQPTQK